MAGDVVNQFGRFLGRNRKNTDFLLRRSKQHFPSLDGARGPIANGFTTYFRTDFPTNRVLMTLNFGMESGGDAGFDDWPTELHIYVDEIDITTWVSMDYPGNFGYELNPDNIYHIWRDIDISSYLNRRIGVHKIEIGGKSDGVEGPLYGNIGGGYSYGSVDVRIEIW